MIPRKFEITVGRNCQLAMELRFAAHLALLWLEFTARPRQSRRSESAYERYSSSVLAVLIVKPWTRSSGQYKLSGFANLDGGH